MRVIIHNINTIYLKHINIVLEEIKKLKLKNGSLTLLTIDNIKYSIWHNKKSFTITNGSKL